MLTSLQGQPRGIVRVTSVGLGLTFSTFGLLVFLYIPLTPLSWRKLGLNLAHPCVPSTWDIALHTEALKKYLLNGFKWKSFIKQLLNSGYILGTVLGVRDKEIRNNTDWYPLSWAG